MINPTLTGGIERVQHQVRQAQAHGLNPVNSSALESFFSLSLLPRLSHWLTPGVLPLLASLLLLQHQVLRACPGSALPVQGSEALSCLWQR
ncbi:MAG TPA: hypothetical protein DD850_06515 [Erwinia persicina]|nr:hypothetical protein [Erwinia persicina]